MTKLEQCARAACLADADADGFLEWQHCGEQDRWRNIVSAVIEALYEPNEEMIRATLVATDITAEHLDAAAAAVEGMPSLPPEKQQQGITVAAHLIRDWQVMLNTIRRET